MDNIVGEYIMPTAERIVVQVKDLRAIRDLLDHHMDHLDDVFAKLREHGVDGAHRAEAGQCTWVRLECRIMQTDVLGCAKWQVHVLAAQALMLLRLTCVAGSVTRQKFSAMVKEALAQNGSTMTSAEVDLLFRALDTNKCAALPCTHIWIVLLPMRR